MIGGGRANVAGKSREDMVECEAGGLGLGEMVEEGRQAEALCGKTRAVDDRAWRWYALLAPLSALTFAPFLVRPQTQKLTHSDRTKQSSRMPGSMAVHRVG